jgi:hypothetical protein
MRKDVRASAQAQQQRARLTHQEFATGNFRSALHRTLNHVREVQFELGMLRTDVERTLEEQEVHRAQKITAKSH